MKLSKKVLTEGKGSYQEYANIETAKWLLISTFVSIAIVSLLSLIINMIVAIFVMVPFWLVLIWKGLKWQFPKYMLINYGINKVTKTINKTINRKLISKNKKEVYKIF